MIQDKGVQKNIVHEIKNSLSIILSSVEFLILQHSRSNKKTRETLIKIKEATLRTDNTIKSLLEYLRLTKTNSELNGRSEVI